MTCDRCYQPSEIGLHGLGVCPLEPRRAGYAVWQDSIEGGLEIRHGLTNPDGSPRWFYSKTEIREASKASGWTPWGDIYESSRTKDADVRADWQRSGEAQRAKQLRDEARAEKRLDEMRAQR